MEFEFTEEQKMLRSSARDFLEKECPASVVNEMEIGDFKYSPELWRKIADLGWLGLTFPEKYGGSGMSVVDLAVLYEEFGRVLLPGPFTSTIVLGGMTVLEAGNDTQKDEILPKIISGDEIISLGLNEPESGWAGMAWNPDDVTIKATGSGDNYILEGVELFVHDGSNASAFLIPARTRNTGNSEEGITLFYVPTDNPGISVMHLTTIATDNQCEVIFNRVRVPKKNIIGQAEGGWAPLARSMQIGAVMLSAQMLGAGERLLEISREDNEAKIQFEGSDAVNRFTEEYLDRLLKDVDGCRWTTYRAAQKLANGEPTNFEATVVSGWYSYARQHS